MYEINNNTSNTIIVKNSKFITNLYIVNNIEDINNYILEIKNKYKDATHHCFAYIINNIEKASDDKEPSGTAGLPILNALKKNNLTNVLCIITRYFGGIKLGAGGLIRAYSKSVSDTIKIAGISKLYKGYNIIIRTGYEKEKFLNNILKDSVIIKTSYEDSIEINVNVSEDIIKKLLDMNIDYTIIKDIYIKKR